MRVVINPGHCTKRDDNGNMLDCGAVGTYSTEAELVEKVAKIVVDDLKLVGYNVLYVQENELFDILYKSDDFEADIFVSIHANACAGHVAEGTETYYFYGSEFGYMLAKCLQHQLLATMHSTNRGIKEAGFQVLRCDAIAALCELDFIDNPAREKYLNEHIEEMAHAISRGITDYAQEIEVWD